MRTLVTFVLIGALMTSGYPGRYVASLSARPVRDNAQADSQVLSMYLNELPVGSRVRVELADGSVVKGTLMSAEEATILIQRRTRIPEPPREVPIASIARVEIEEGSNLGKAIAIGAGAGAAAALGVFLLILAVLSN